jgi:hypothetical protein
MSGINQSKVTITLRNPLNFSDQIKYTITPNDSQLAKDWIIALKKLLVSGNLLEKNFCFMGFSKTARTLEYLCNELNSAIETINCFDFTQHGLERYYIEEWFHSNVVRFPDTYKVQDGYPGLYIKHNVMNRLHNHFEILQGTVNNLSKYYKVADYQTKYAIRELNTLCHEIESLVLSQRKAAMIPMWQRPSQITTFLHAERYVLTDEHRQGFVSNGYDRKFGHIYMHWAQIGKTLFEVFRDEGAPILTDTICEAINSLEYYSGEFDVEWARDVTLELGYPWHNKEQQEFNDWLIANGLDPTDPKLSLGYLEIGKVDLSSSFGTTAEQEIWDILSNYLDIYSIEVDGIAKVFDYCWSDSNYKQQQIETLRPGYDFSSRG